MTEVNDMPASLLTAGVTASQFAAGLAAGVDANAAAVCFTAEYLTVPDDPNFLVSAGHPFSHW